MLSGEEIIKQVEAGRITINPFNMEQVNPNSYNLTLHDELTVYLDDVLDCAKPSHTRTIRIPDDGYVLAPGQLYLAHSREYTKTPDHIPMISGRSSIGRVGVTAHISSGLGSIGYEGYWKLGITCLTPTRVFPGMELCQIYYCEVDGKASAKYQGKYVGVENSSVSLSYIDFDKKR